MLTIIKANIFHFSKLYKILSNLKYDKSFITSLYFYSKFDGNLFLQIMLGNVYIIFDKKKIKGFIVFDKKNSNLYFIPESNDISIFKLLHLVKRSIGLTGLSMTLNYKNMNLHALKKQFPMEVLDNVMFMSIENNFEHSMLLELDASIDSKVISTRNLQINKEENLRVELQNSIFSNIKNRMPLTLDDILYEEGSSKFLKDFCFIFEEFRVPIGYGQILKFNNHYFLVNFGIVEGFRKKGYAYHFLYNILKECFNVDIRILYLTVDKSNFAAINLYRKIGFQEVHNSVTFEFK